MGPGDAPSPAFSRSAEGTTVFPDRFALAYVALAVLRAGWQQNPAGREMYGRIALWLERPRGPLPVSWDDVIRGPMTAESVRLTTWLSRPEAEDVPRWRDALENVARYTSHLAEAWVPRETLRFRYHWRLPHQSLSRWGLSPDLSGHIAMDWDAALDYEASTALSVAHESSGIFRQCLLADVNGFLVSTCHPAQLEGRRMKTWLYPSAAWIALIRHAGWLNPPVDRLLVTPPDMPSLAGETHPFSLGLITDRGQPTIAMAVPVLAYQHVWGAVIGIL